MKRKLTELQKDFLKMIAKLIRQDIEKENEELLRRSEKNSLERDEKNKPGK